MSRPLPQSYLLRLWREQPDAPVRATLIAVGQPEAHQHFASGSKDARPRDGPHFGSERDLG